MKSLKKTLILYVIEYLSIISAVIFFIGWTYIFFYFSQFGLRSSLISISINDYYVYGTKVLLDYKNLIAITTITIIIFPGVILVSKIINTLKVTIKLKTKLIKILEHYSLLDSALEYKKIILQVLAFGLIVIYLYLLAKYIGIHDAQVNKNIEKSSLPNISVLIDEKNMILLSDFDRDELKKGNYRFLYSNDNYIFTVRLSSHTNNDSLPRILSIPRSDIKYYILNR